MIVQNSIFRTNLFRIESFGSWLCPFCQNVAAGRNSERNLNRRMENFPVSLEMNKEFSEKLTQSKFKIAVKNVSHCSLFQVGCIVRECNFTVVFSRDKKIMCLRVGLCTCIFCRPKKMLPCKYTFTGQHQPLCLAGVAQ